MVEYKKSDLRIDGDGVLLVKQTFGPTMAAEYLVAQLVRDLTLMKSLPITVDYVDGWWLVASAMDWLLASDGSISLRNFKCIVHFPAGGREACHSEILLTAFANAVVTRGSDRELIVITGDDDVSRLPESVHKHLLRSNSGRSIAFRGN